MKCLSELLPLFVSPDIPARGAWEEELDAPFWQAGCTATPKEFPGEGLARYPMLYIGEGCNRIFLLHEGSVVWSYDTGKGWELDDVWMLQNGNILFSRMYWAAEVTPGKEQVWRVEAKPGEEIHAVQPIGPDKVFLVVNSDKGPYVQIIHKPTGRAVYEHAIPYEPMHSAHGQFRRGRITAQGTILLPYLSLGKVVEYDRDFNVLWSYQVRSPWAAVRLANGSTLITNEQDETMLEVTAQGEVAWRLCLSELPEDCRPYGTQSCVRLKNGNTIICSRGDNRNGTQLLEVTQDMRVVWAVKDWRFLGPATAVQILTDPGVSEIPGDCWR